MKNALTLIGGILLALGPVFMHAAANSTMWWLGMSFAAVGPVLIGSRGLFDSSPPPEPPVKQNEDQKPFFGFAQKPRD